VLDGLESDGAAAAAVAGAGTVEVVESARRITALLECLECDLLSKRDRPRVAAVRVKVEAALRRRMETGIRDELAARLNETSTPFEPADQTRLETSARAIRSLNMVARKIGSPAKYDAMMEGAITTVHDAATSGRLNHTRHCRLVEILAGSQAALALYQAPAT